MVKTGLRSDRMLEGVVVRGGMGEVKVVEVVVE